jgi:beta-galactosidase
MWKTDQRDPLHTLVRFALTLLCAELFMAGIHAAAALDQDSPRERTSFNTDWRFQKGDPADASNQLTFAKMKDWIVLTGQEFVNYSPSRPARLEGNPGGNISCVRPDFDDSGWRKLDLPHDWGIEGPFKQEEPGDTGKLPWPGVGWYRKHFTVPAEDNARQIYLDIDGAMSYAVGWLNGQFVGGWPYGYSSFRLNLTPYIKFGAENVLAVRLDNPTESSRWYPGAGLYRNVWLVNAAPVNVAHWGTFVTTPLVTKDAATVEVNVILENHTKTNADVQVATAIHELDADGRKTGRSVATVDPVKMRVSAGRQAFGAFSLTVSSPKLWSLTKPQRYVAVTTVEQKGRIVDRDETPFGIRTIQFDADQGFLLNGEHVRLNGVCNHHDLGALGTAINVRALERQLEMLREMGCNAIRTSHNPPAPELLDLCDRMGFVVMDEAFDCWARKKRNNDYHLLFADWHEKDLRALIRRDRNHPCVVLWSIGNEIREQAAPEGWKLAAHLAGIVREEDRTRPVTAACSAIDAGYNGFQIALDVMGYNYKPMEYGNFRGRNPLIPILGSETASTVSSRGEYFFPLSDDKLQGQADFQVSSYDRYAPEWAFRPAAEWKGLDEFPFVAGEFVWTGFDYLGEPTPYNGNSTNLLHFTNPVDQARAEKELKETGNIRIPSRSSYFGIIDLAGFPKDRFYLYQARWRPDLPMAHILPHWNWPERLGQTTPVHVYTAGDEAELFLNGKSLGRKEAEASQYRLHWDDVKYEPGELKVVVYRNGKEWAQDQVSTTGPAAKLLLKPDRAKIKADRLDLSFVTVSIADKEGRTVPRAKNQVKLQISGPGVVAAVDNGDATSFEPFQASERNAYNGLCLVIVRGKAGEPGTITLTAQSEGLASAQVSVLSEAE